MHIMRYIFLTLMVVTLSPDRAAAAEASQRRRTSACYAPPPRAGGPLEQKPPKRRRLFGRGGVSFLKNSDIFESSMLALRNVKLFFSSNFA